MTEDRDAKHERNIKELMSFVPEHEKADWPVREEGETARKYARRLRKYAYRNARQVETWAVTQRQRNT